MVTVAGRVSAQAPAAPGAAPPSLQLNSENVRLNNYLHDLAGPGPESKPEVGDVQFSGRERKSGGGH